MLGNSFIVHRNDETCYYCAELYKAIRRSPSSSQCDFIVRVVSIFQRCSTKASVCVPNCRFSLCVLKWLPHRLEPFCAWGVAHRRQHHIIRGFFYGKDLEHFHKLTENHHEFMCLLAFRFSKSTKMQYECFTFSASITTKKKSSNYIVILRFHVSSCIVIPLVWKLKRVNFDYHAKFDDFNACARIFFSRAWKLFAAFIRIKLIDVHV